MPRSSSPPGAGLRKVKRRKSSGYANPREQAMYGGSRKSRVVKARKVEKSLRTGRRTAAVKAYKTRGPGKISAKQEAIALRTLARQATSPSDWRRLQIDSPTGYALPKLESSTTKRRSPKQDDEQAWVETLLFGSQGIDSQALKDLNKAVEKIPGFGKGEFFGDKGGLEKFQNTRLGEQAMLVTGGEAGASAVGKGARTSVRAISRGKSAAGKAARSRVATTTEKVGGSRAGRAIKSGAQKAKQSKTVQTAKQTTEKVAAKTPKPVKAVGKGAGKAAKGTARHVARRKWAYAAGPGAITAYGATKGHPDAALTALSGIATATYKHPGDTAKATARAFPGMVKATGEIIVDPALSAYRAGATALGTENYSGKEILDPTTGMISSQAKGLKDFYDTYASGDKKRIEQATQNDYGIIPVTAVLPVGARVLKRPYENVRGRVRERASLAREKGPRKYKVVGPRQDGKDGRPDRRVSRKVDPKRPASDLAWRRKQRKEASDLASFAMQGMKHENAFRTNELLRATSRLIRSAFTKAERKQAKDLGIVPGADAFKLIFRKGIDPNNPEAARRILTADLARAQRHAEQRRLTLNTPNPKIVLKDATTTEVALDFLLQGNRLERMLADKNFRKAREEYKKTGQPEQEGGLSYSERQRLMAVARERNNPILLPEQRTPMAARKRGVPVNRAEAEKMFTGRMVDKGGRSRKKLGTEEKRLRELRREIRRRSVELGKNQALQRTGRDILRLEKKRAQAKSPEEIAGIDVWIGEKKKLYEAQKAERATAQAELGQMRTKAKLLGKRNKEVRRALNSPVVDKALQAEYEAAVQAAMKQEGRIEPLRTTQNAVYQGTSDVHTTSASTSSLSKTKGEHESRGITLDTGNVDESFKSLVENSIRVPVARRWVFGMWKDFFEGTSLRNKRGNITALNGVELTKMEQKGEINFVDYTAFPLQQAKRVWTNRTRSASGKAESIQPTDLELLNELTTEVDNARNLAQSNPDLAPGVRYIVLPREGLSEMLKQTESMTRMAKAGHRLNWIQSKALLATSPAWLGMQFIAETMQAASATSATGIPTPLSIAQIWGIAPGRRGKMVRAANEFAKTGDEAGLRFITICGEAPGVGNPITGFRPNLTASDLPNASAAIGVLHQNRGLEYLDRLIRLDTLGDIDRWKAGAIRRGVAASYVDKRLNSFTANLKNLIGVQDEIFKKLKGKSLEEQLRFFATDSKASRELQSYMTDVMGEWYALTSIERIPASLAMFYPYIRMSLRVSLWGYPKRHPFKAGLLQVLGAANAEQLTDLLHGDPSLFARYASPVIYGGKGGSPTSLIDLSRAVPGSNALVEGLMGPDPWSAILGASPPILGAGFGLVTGKMPFTGEQLPSDFKTRVSTVAASLLALPAPLRAIDQLNLNNIPLLGPVMNMGESDVSKMIQDATEVNGKRILFPPYPRSLRAVRNESQINDLFTRTNNKKAADAEFSGATPQRKKELLRVKRSGQKASDSIQRMMREAGFPDQQYSKRESDLYSRFQYGQPKKKQSSSGGGGSGGSPVPFTYRP